MKQKGFAPILVLVLILLAVAGFFAYRNGYFANLQFPKTPMPISTPSSPPIMTSSPTALPTTSSTQQWKTAKFGGLFSYEYPYGWDVAQLWQDNYSQNGILIAIDPNPIDTAPRGGPMATFEITVINGNKNPDEILATKMAAFNETNYTDITKETINAKIGAIYHYTGKMAGDYAKGEPVESYFFTFNQNPNDPLNQQVVIANLTFNHDPQMSAMLRHIVLSFKKLTP